MSTNYYIRPQGACPVQCDRWIHLGSSAIGWTFNFRAYPKPRDWDEHDPITWPVTDYGSWLKLLELGDIHDEYGKPVTRDDLLALIDAKRAGRNDLSRNDYHDLGGHHFIAEWFS